MGSGRCFLIYELEAAFHHLPVVLRNIHLVLLKRRDWKLFILAVWLRGHREEIGSLGGRSGMETFKEEKSHAAAVNL